MNPYLLELAKQSTDEVEKNHRKFYWQGGDYKFNNYNVARWFEKESNSWVDFCDSETQTIKKVLQNTSIDLEKNYNLDFIKALKSKFKTVNLLFSGGYESTTIFYEFVENNIPIDETITIIGQKNEPEITDEIMSSIDPLLEQYGNLVNKKTFIRYDQNFLCDYWKDENVLLSNPLGDRMPPPPTYVGLNFYRKNIDKTNCIIKGIDKPQLVFYKNKWYVTMIDHCLGTHYELPHLTYFWMDAGNIKSLVKDAILYRNHLIKTDAVYKDFHFFRFYTQEDLNYVINRRTPPGIDKKLDKIEKEKIRMLRQQEDQNFELMFYYNRAVANLMDSMPELKDGFKNYWKTSGKFAWFIDLDSLEVYTQTELIPNGFEN